MDWEKREAPSIEEFERLAAEAQAGRAPDVEAVAREHPDLAAELRTLWAMAAVADDIAGHSGLEELAADQGLSSAPTGNGLLPRRVGDYELLAADDPVHAWRKRMLDLHGGLARRTRAYSG